MRDKMKTKNVYIIITFNCVLPSMLFELYSNISKNIFLVKRVESLRIIHRGIMNASDTKGEFINSDVLDINGTNILSWCAEIVPFLFVPHHIQI